MTRIDVNDLISETMYTFFLMSNSIDTRLILRSSKITATLGQQFQSLKAEILSKLLSLLPVFLTFESIIVELFSNLEPRFQKYLVTSQKPEAQLENGVAYKKTFTHTD